MSQFKCRYIGIYCNKNIGDFMCNFNVYNFIIGTISIIAAIIVSALFYLGFITDILPAVTIIAIIAAVILFIIILLLVIPCFNSKTLNKCLCKFASYVIIGSIGTILASIVAFVITLAATSILSAAVIFFLILFFVIALIGFILLLNCILCSKCERYNNNCCNVNSNQDERRNDCGLKFME